MENSISKIKTDFSNAPLGAIIGGAIGYIIAKNVKYDNTITVISFAVVGIIIGASIGQKIK